MNVDLCSLRYQNGSFLSVIVDIMYILCLITLSTKFNFMTAFLQNILTARQRLHDHLIVKWHRRNRGVKGVAPFPLSNLKNRKNVPKQTKKPQKKREEQIYYLLRTYLFDFHVYIQVYDLNKHAIFPKCPPQQPPCCLQTPLKISLTAACIILFWENFMTICIFLSQDIQQHTFSHITH